MAVVRATLFVILLLTGLFGSSVFGVSAGQATVGEVSAQVHCSAITSCSDHTGRCDAATCVSSTHCTVCAAVLPPTDAPAQIVSYRLQKPPARFRLADGRAIAPANEPPRRT